jgi:hypothetical protein
MVSVCSNHRCNGVGAFRPFFQPAALHKAPYMHFVDDRFVKA